MIDRLLNDRYRVEAELGRGGMSIAYRAYDTLLNRPVAIKVLDVSELGMTGRARLLAEARAAAGLNHPNIVAVYDVGEVDGVPFIVMELVQGESLRAQPPDSLEATLRLARQICAALDHAHGCGVIHRDLKPENVVVTTTQTAKLMDFGLARSAGAPHLTQEGAIVGTVAYLAPELIQGQPATAQSDLYALGVMLYEWAAGRPPFDGDTLTTLLSQHLYAPVVPPSTYQPGIPAWLDDLVGRLLSKQPQERPASAADVLRTLEQPLTPAPLPLYQSPARPTHNVPVPLSQFIGREKELGQVKPCLARHRLVTLTGSGGIGKTRLAIEAARGLLSEYPDGVWLAELAPVADPRLVPRAVAAVWDVREEQGRPLHATLADYLREKTLLLVLDNCEHVLDASAQLAGYLLQRCPGLLILASSREALGVEGELVMRVPSLSLPPAGPAPRERLQGSEAVRLFVSRAATALPGFELTEANAAAVAQVCLRLDGVALALELAAARVMALRVEQIAARLDDAFHLLTGGSRTALPRQQTLRATIDWSHALLSDAERACFRRLAVFASGWTLEAAEAVCSGDGVEACDVLDLLTQLGNKSLLVIDREPGKEARYRLLETIRQYAQEKLQAAEEQAECRTQHLAYYCRLAQEVEPKLYGAEQLEGLAQLDAEPSNIRAALEWGLGNGLEAGARLAAAMVWYWHLRGLWPDGYAWLQRALAAVPGATKSLRALLLSRAGHLAWQLRDVNRVAPYCEESIALYRELGDQGGMAFSVANLGLCMALHQGDLERGRALLQQSVDLCRQAGDKWGCRHALAELGVTYGFAMERFQEAAACFEESLALARELAIPDGIAWALYCLGILAFFRGDDERAMALFAEGLPLSRAIGLRSILIESLFWMQVITLRQADFEQAKALAREALTVEMRRTGLRFSWRLSLADAGSPWRMEALLSEYLALARKSDDSLVIAHALFAMAASAWASGHLEKAARLYAAALAASAGALPSTPLERTDFDHSLTGTLIQLDEAAFQRAWAEGSAMTVDQAVAHAQQKTP